MPSYRRTALIRTGNDGRRCGAGPAWHKLLAKGGSPCRQVVSPGRNHLKAEARQGAGHTQVPCLSAAALVQPLGAATPLSAARGYRPSAVPGPRLPLLPSRVPVAAPAEAYVSFGGSRLLRPSAEGGLLLCDEPRPSASIP